MKKNMLILCGALLGAPCLVYGDATPYSAASRAWVTNYVASAMATQSTSVSNGVEYATYTAGDVTFRMEKATDAALMATNATAAAIGQGITNGCLFVWNGAGAYINPAGTVTSTATNLVYSGVSSTDDGGVVSFDGWFDAAFKLIQPSRSFSITNNMEAIQ